MDVFFSPVQFLNEREGEGQMKRTTTDTRNARNKNMKKIKPTEKTTNYNDNNK